MGLGYDYGELGSGVSGRLCGAHMELGSAVGNRIELLEWDRRLECGLLDRDTDLSPNIPLC